MTISEWLRRLNLHKYSGKFREKCYRRVQDLRFLGEGDLQAMEMNALLDRKRVMGMVAGEEQCKTLFALQTRPQARTIIA